MDNSTLSPFQDLIWYKLEIELINVRVSDSVKSHAFSIIEAIIKAVTSKTSNQKKQKYFFI
ncbi:MAG: hypothetical protein HY934_06615 [Candidatus Firestonebacteria bacterium]|nr:hypothetical protein [Candidatus Firestonebacteria bacterium]